MSAETKRHNLFGLRCPDCKKPISEEDVFCPHCGVNLEEQISQTPPAMESLKPKRGFWLTAVLIVWFFGSLYALLNNLIPLLENSQTSTPLAYAWVFLRVILNIVFLVALWNLKRWGVYGILFMLGLGVLINIGILLGAGAAQNLPNLIGVVIGSLIGVGIVATILYFTLRGKWKQMT